MSAARNGGLGKGLEALFGDVEITVGESKNNNQAGEASVSLIDIHAIRPNGNQPRKTFDEDKLTELASSIEQHGMIQPIIVRSSGTGYEIVAGERRWRAAKKAGMKEVPCLIRKLTDEQNALIALIENMQREDLNAIEEAIGLERMINTFGFTQEQVSKSIGKSRPYIANSLRLLRLTDYVQQMVIDGRLTSGHARAIVGIKEKEDQILAAKKCVQANWTVRDIEAYVKDRQLPEEPKRPQPRRKNREIIFLEEELKNVLGTKVNIRHGPKKGKIEIEYFSRDELERILELFQSLK